MFWGCRLSKGPAHLGLPGEGLEHTQQEGSHKNWNSEAHAVWVEAQVVFINQGLEAL